MLSVIIPTLNEEAALARTLAQFERLPGAWEVIVADSGSGDRTVEIARERGAMVVENAPAGRGAAMNAGAARATGEILIFLHADTLLPDTSYGLITDALSDPGVAGTAFRLRMDNRDWRYRMLTAVATLRFRIQNTFFGDQAIAVRRRNFERIGGYREPLLMEDVDLSRRLRRTGTLKLLPAHVTTSVRRFEQGGVLRQLLQMSLLQAAYAAGVPAERLLRWYRDARSDTESDWQSPERIDLDQLALLDDGDCPFDPDMSEQHGPILLVFLRWLG